LATISGSVVGQHYGLTVERLQSLTEAEQLAWIWVVMNEQALHGLRAQSNATVVAHEALCADPIRECQRLFKFCRLPWNSQTEEFISTAQSYSGTPSYYDVKRNPTDELNKWQQELEPDVIKRIKAVLDQSPLSECFG